VPKIISECFKLMQLCDINCNGPVLFLRDTDTVVLLLVCGRFADDNPSTLSCRMRRAGPMA